MFRQTNFLLKRASGLFVKRELSETSVEISEELRNALANNLPVVALESTIITHGMPFPQNVECALQVEDVVRKQGAVPATIAIINGKIKVGLNEGEINQLGDTESSKPIKTSRRDLAYVVSNKKNGGTTVSGTLIVANKTNLPIFATGGIGGVHREAEKTFDVSADLVELGKSNVAVVSSGVKSILDIPKTLEFLETQGVFVATFGQTNDFPAFYATKSGSKVPYFVQTEQEAANIIRSNRELNMQSGMLFGVPIPEEFAFNSEIINTVIDKALKEAKDKDIEGKLITPFLLSRIASITEGKSLISNIELIKNNAKVAANIAVALSRLEKSERCTTTTGNENIERRPIIIGGSNMDCSATLNTEEIKLDGRIYQSRFTYSPGGVGRNMCEAMFKLGCPPNFLTMVGNDFHGVHLKTSIPSECSNLLKINKARGTAQCIIVFDKAGSCKMLMGDMEIHKEITPQVILDCEVHLKQAPLIIMDGNLSVQAMDETLRIAEKHNIPVFFEPTDAAVAEKPFKSKHLKAIKFITPNVTELQEIANLLNIKYKKSPSLEEIGLLTKQLVNYVDNIIVTLGSQGILVGRQAKATDTFQSQPNDSEISVRHYSTSEITDLVNVSGAGDCFASGFISALVSNKSEEICISVGFAAAKLALYSEAAVPKSIFDKSHICWNTPAKYVTIL